MLAKQYTVTLTRPQLLALLRYQMQRFMISKVSGQAVANQIEDADDIETIARLAESKLKYTNTAAQDRADLDLFLSLAQLTDNELDSQRDLALTTLKKDIEYLIRAGKAGIKINDV